MQVVLLAAPVEVGHPRGAPSVKEDLAGVSMRDDPKVAPGADGIEVGGRGAAPEASFGGQLEVSDSFL